MDKTLHALPSDAVTAFLAHGTSAEVRWEPLDFGESPHARCVQALIRVRTSHQLWEGSYQRLRHQLFHTLGPRLNRKPNAAQPGHRDQPVGTRGISRDCNEILNTNCKCGILRRLVQRPLF